MRAAFVLLTLSLPVHAEENPGATIYQQVCTACHGENGGGNAELKSPPIAGLPRWYIGLQLDRFQEGLRGAHPEDATGNQMAIIAKTLKPESLAAVSLFVSGMEKVSPEPAHGVDPERGKTLYLERCASCHRFNASGEQVFRSPPLNAFPTWYLQSQFEKFMNGQRGAIPNDPDGEKMRIIAATEIPDGGLEDIIGFIVEASTAD